MMPRNLDISADDFVDHVMTAFPGTIAVFMRRRMSCVGCLMGPFHTVADAAEEYAIDVDELLAELRQSAARRQQPHDLDDGASFLPQSGQAHADP